MLWCLVPAPTGNWIREVQAGFGQFGEAAKSDGLNFHSTYVMYFRGSHSLNCENRTISSLLERTQGCIVGSGLGPEPERQLSSKGTRNFPGSLAAGPQVERGVQLQGGGLKARGAGHGAPEPLTCLTQPRPREGGRAHTPPFPPPWGAAAAGRCPWAPPGRLQGAVHRLRFAETRSLAVGKQGWLRVRGAPQTEAVGLEKLEVGWLEAGILCG